MLPRNNFYKDYRKLLRLINDGTVFTAVDTETTGLNPEEGRVIEIGAVRFSKDGILNTFNTLINPLIPIPQISQNVSHISDEMVAESPVIKDVLPQFLEFIGDTMLVGHNVGFDMAFLNAELIRNSMEPFTNKAVDTLGLTRWAYPKAESHRLQYLANLMKIDVREAHRACDDARVCMEVFFRSVNDTKSIQKV